MTSDSPNILLFGVGSIGSVYAAIFVLSERCNVHLVARSNYDVLKDRGLKLVSPKFGNHDALQFDGVYRTCEEAAASGTKFNYTEKTSIVLFQNGVGAEEPLHASFPSTPIISACVWTGAKVLDVGEVEQFNTEGLTIGVDYAAQIDRKTQDDALKLFVDVLKAGGSDVKVTDDIQSERWVKVIWNACWNAVTTATQLRTNRFLGASPHALTLSRAIMAEVAAVARAKGLTVPEGTEEGLIVKCTSVKEGLPSSMMFDYLAGRPMEVEVILGTPLREGLRLGVPVPSLTAMYSIVKALDWKNAHPEEAKI
ncbi:hypothetical protein QFC20_005359 [Naganishia adeliensis]|uniref:Uncharacterized protein n=1 Tax=Naganishia adeliensis TaxID=92952 RepID=A0ACC2VN68_9TREE|nr:hypothetical protein QFC20_005359 [Naganishia adeliensis]